MAQSHVQLPADSTGKNLGTDTWTNSESLTVHGQSFVLYGPDGNVLSTLAAAPTGTEKGLIVRPIQSDIVVTGTITATDAVVAAPGGAGALVTGASTAGSLVAIQSGGGDNAWTVQVTGLTSGTLYFEASVDSTTGTDGNWINLNGRQSGIVNTVLAGNMTANGIFRGNMAGFRWFRLRSVGALSGTPAINLRLSDAEGAVFLNAGLPPSSDEIGRVRITDGTNIGAVKAASTAPVAADPSQVVSVHPSGAGVNAQGSVAGTPTAISAVSPGAASRTALDVNIASSAGAFAARSTNTFANTPTAGGSITLPNTANVANTTVTVACANAGNATIDMSASAYVGSIIFEGSADGGTTWATISATREDGSGQDTATSFNIVASSPRIWTTAAPGFTHIRVRATAWTSGTATFGITLGAFLIETSVAATTQAPLNQSIDGAGVPQPFLFGYINTAAAVTGAAWIAAPAAGRAIRVVSYMVIAGGAQNVSFIGPATTILLPLAANGGVSFAGTLQGPAFQCAAATALTYTLSASVQTTVHIAYVVV